MWKKLTALVICLMLLCTGFSLAEEPLTITDAGQTFEQGIKASRNAFGH